MYLKIQHEKEAVVELNNAKDLETENIDGHEAFDTKPNEGAGGNDTSKNTCNSPGSIFLENNVTRVNKEAKKTKDLENNSRLEIEIVTNKEKQQDKALIQHEKEAVVELNNAKDLETENIDGHEAFDTKPNEGAGGNDTSKNTCNSPGSIFLENNVTRVNKEAKKTKDLENNSRLESEIVTNKEKQQDKALVNNGAHILQITKLQEKLAQSLNIMNINMNSSQVRQNKNVQNNLKCNTRLPFQQLSIHRFYEFYLTNNYVCLTPDKTSKADSVDEWFQKLSQSQFLDEDDADYVEDDDYKINNHNYRYINAYHLMT
ncbi:hypothetical protein J6590_095737 [Homalodisca vitripennis]|nr:hypothetical protein J6590_095737 [Homalodisca vitripennis]